MSKQNQFDVYVDKDESDGDLFIVENTGYGGDFHESFYLPCMYAIDAEKTLDALRQTRNSIEHVILAYQRLHAL